MYDYLKNTDKEFEVLGLGEVLLRLSPPNKERIVIEIIRRKIPAKW